MKKLAVPNVVVVEGKYDKNKLSGVIEADVITTDGFSIFNEKEKERLLVRLSEKRPIIVLTDSDGAGLVIRNRINSILDRDRVIHLYIPEIKGKEKRKARPSKAGTLGVEGMENELLYSLFLPFADQNGRKPEDGKKITRTELYADGLFGKDDSSFLRKKLMKRFSLPENLSAGAMLDVINLLYTYEEYKDALSEIKEDKNDRI